MGFGSSYSQSIGRKNFDFGFIKSIDWKEKTEMEMEVWKMMETDDSSKVLPTTVAPRDLVKPVRPSIMISGVSGYNLAPALTRRPSESIRTNDWSNVDAWKSRSNTQRNDTEKNSTLDNTKEKEGSNSGAQGSNRSQSRILAGLDFNRPTMTAVVRSSLPPSSPPRDLLSSSPLPYRGHSDARRSSDPTTPSTKRVISCNGSRYSRDSVPFGEKRRMLGRSSDLHSRPHSRPSSRQRFLQSPTPSRRSASLLSLDSVASLPSKRIMNSRDFASANLDCMDPNSHNAGTKLVLTKISSHRSKRKPEPAEAPVRITIYEDLPAVGLDSVLSIPDLSSSPGVLAAKTGGACGRSKNAGNRVGMKRKRSAHTRSHTATACGGLPRKVKRVRGARKNPELDNKLDREEFDLDVSSDTEKVGKHVFVEGRSYLIVFRRIRKQGRRGLHILKRLKDIS